MSVLYTFPIGRAFPTAIINHFKLDIKIASPADDELFAKQFPLKKVPALVDVNEETGEVFKLTEVIAIVQYLLEKVGTEESKALLGGDSIQNRAAVTKWMSLWNSDIISQGGLMYRQIKGVENFNKKTFDAAKETLENIIVNVVEARLRDFTYLVGEELTAADYFAACVCTFFFTFAFDKAWVAKHPVFMRWLNTVKAQTLVADAFKTFTILDAALTPAQKKKEQKPKQEQPKKEAKAAKPAEEAEPAPEKKAKHPLEALGKSSKFVLDEWKRQYSNNDTRPVALPWFFEHYDPSEWSIWRVDYKYNDELTMTFMSNNLVGGFFNRLTGSVKYMFGCLVVYGENNDNGIVGAVLVRGQDFKPAFEVAPDWESYAYTKLDASKEEDKKFIENMWAWDEPVVVDGVSKEIADGKVLK
ncbi:hypothetical protein ACO0OL_003301 [Hanseniaspora opuntiae]|uniref:Elongation factor 1-gamma 2 n=1 Tax=Hanseniaspora opuntiae TaxID=211096 RepID=A0A1E5R3R8_9ASCO|nr:Elongation factor 1-gamma 2 [Hanseniaspora opuntiae]